MNVLHSLFKNVCVLSPHTDDGELAAGGTIIRLLEEGSNIFFVAFSAWRPILKSECKKSLATLGVEDYEILDFPRRHFPDKRQELLQYLYDLNLNRKFDMIPRQLVPKNGTIFESSQRFIRNCLVVLMKIISGRR